MSKPKIAWKTYNACNLPASLTVGEEKLFTASEISEINSVLDQIAESTQRLRVLFERARASNKAEFGAPLREMAQIIRDVT